ncbi:hypothetical protein THII_1660 [Thioploca ingrica]|uniref:DUF4340 domain-containing protein n=1 Tax=Thioploca ingrica TaxID=40754 RepID=A0A090AK16_9GAMM|nr:hypothetical protein THII_1660 [Thioploca ingrica]
MNIKNLIILTMITLAVIITAAVLNQPQTTTISESKKLFPHLLKALDRVSEITVSTKNEVATLTRPVEGQWQLKEKHNYPVSPDKIHKLLIGVADLVTLEAKTNNPKLYSKLGVEDITAEASQSKLLTLKNAEGKTLASLIVGNDKVAKTDPTLQEIYVRRAEDKQAWLVIGQLTVEKAAANWLNAKIVDVDSARVSKINITHPDGEEIAIFKTAPQAEEFQLAYIPEKAKVKMPHVLKNIATTLSNLELDDVTTANEITFTDDASTRAVFTTFDGLEITMVTMNKDNKHYAKFSAAFTPKAVWTEPQEPTQSATEKEQSPANPTEKVANKTEKKTPWQPKPADEINKQVETLNAQFKDWVYILSDYKVDDLAKKQKDLIEEESSTKAEKPVADEVGEPATAIEEITVPVEN